ncbi:hypothetical protein C499_17584 [Halogeometricum borinquense DSM 11551]|uniref:Uncharacterized protein n=2 Tax=Halogeometricum borinquense TaxID=60847 RepID=E4NPY8_HALBP|nr:hypothetical protein [Halogeometricum borinquense]ADQ67733.1 hypothetical protein Hbor_21690 [Halogeometricum borinquense DSM 11551]ELY23586.1 hypothetical protein C499_17584 [Halogeometricum borinquense DSM 11551]RYJ14843.1 hypothetical protein ELS19_13365 [Halogeometricum borinquense]
MNVSVDYSIKEEVIDINDLLGGIAVTVNDDSIARVVNEDNFESRYEWKPTYMGQYIQTDFQRLIDASSMLARNELDIYQTKEITFPPSKSYLLLEPLSEGALRVAYRIRESRDHSTSKTPSADPESACGYVVKRCEFCRAVSEAAHEYVNDVRSMPVEWGMELLEEFEQSLAELDAAIEDCE